MPGGSGYAVALVLIGPLGCMQVTTTVALRDPANLRVEADVGEGQKTVLVGPAVRAERPGNEASGCAPTAIAVNVPVAALAGSRETNVQVLQEGAVISISSQWGGTRKHTLMDASGHIVIVDDRSPVIMDGPDVRVAYTYRNGDDINYSRGYTIAHVDLVTPRSNVSQIREHRAPNREGIGYLVFGVLVTTLGAFVEANALTRSGRSASDRWGDVGVGLVALVPGLGLDALGLWFGLAPESDRTITPLGRLESLPLAVRDRGSIWTFSTDSTALRSDLVQRSHDLRGDA